MTNSYNPNVFRNLKTIHDLDDFDEETLANNNIYKIGSLPTDLSSFRVWESESLKNQKESLLKYSIPIGIEFNNQLNASRKRVELLSKNHELLEYHIRDIEHKVSNSNEITFIFS